MKIVVNAQPLSGPQTGIARYVRSLYRRLRTHEGVDVACLNGVLAESAMPSGRIAAAALPVWMRSSVRDLHRAWHDRTVVWRTSRHGGEIYHETTMLGPRRRLPIPVAMTVYDLSLQHWGQYHPPDRVRHYGRHFERRLANVDHVLTLSAAVRQEFIDTFAWPPERVTAVPLAAETVFSPRSEDQVARFRQTHGIPERYLLHVGAREPRKNLPLLLAAMAESPSDLPLVCVGPPGWYVEQFERAVRRFELDSRVMVLRSCSDDELALLYSGAWALVYPSLYEGFGLPVLEAMACGCPVICSDTGSLAEVAGTAALAIDPNDRLQLVAALNRLADDDSLRTTLSRRGLERAADFSWQATAEHTRAVFARLCV